MTEQYANRSHPEHVVLEIGEDVGAIVVYTAAELHGTEIEISASGNDRDRTHKDVLNRPINSRPTYAAVFDKIQEGSYTLWIGGAAIARDVVVAGAASPSSTGAAYRRPLCTGHRPCTLIDEMSAISTRVGLLGCRATSGAAWPDSARRSRCCT